MGMIPLRWIVPAVPSAANSFGGQNYAFWCDPQAQPLFNQELSTTDPAVRQDAFNKLHQIYLTQFPFITEYAPVDASVVKSSGHNYAPGPMGAQETVNVWNWWVPTASAKPLASAS